MLVQYPPPRQLFPIVLAFQQHSENWDRPIFAMFKKALVAVVQVMCVSLSNGFILCANVRELG